MPYLRILALVLVLGLLSGCGMFSDDSSADPESGQAAEEATQQEPTTTTMDQVAPCKVVNVDEDDCSFDLSNALTSILKSQGEGEDFAQQAGAAIAKAIKSAPLDKRNGFKMKGRDTGKDFTFVFQTVNGESTLQLIDKKPEAGEEVHILASQPLMSCDCQE